ncbi:MAG: sulfatase-like hydrolase/transferase [Thermomicrobiales bacterium]|nr:sulfatase-like hydrolase/transferase [Thermomicrobiales bacterium]
MNTVIIMADTFRRDHIAAYGVPAPWSRPGHENEPFIDTPNLDRLASQSALFDRFYLSSYPTVPCRSDLFTGTFGFPHRGWQPLEPDDVILSELAAANGYVPAFIFDTPMLVADSYNYSRGFAAWDFIRGQHSDRWDVDPVVMPMPAPARKLKSVPATQRYLRNTRFRQSENDWMCAKTVTRAIDWLDGNKTRDSFLLWIDMWDPHEPFDAPDADLARYADPSFSGGQNIYPSYGRAEYMTKAERNHVRALYAALATVTDRWIGHLLDALTSFGLDGNTMVVFLSDHGHLFGDHGLQGKPTGPLGKLYEVTTRCPLMIRHPGGAGAGLRSDAIAQHPDVTATILDALGIEAPASMQGQSLLPVMRGESSELRPFAVSGRFSRLIDTGAKTSLARQEAAEFDGAAGIATPGEPLTITTERWAYCCPARGNEADELYDLDNDPAQQHNVAADHPEVVAALRSTLVTFLRETGAPEARVAVYERAQPAGPALMADETPLFVIDNGPAPWLAWLSEAEAASRIDGDIAGTAVERTTFGALRTGQDAVLIHIHDQFYAPGDLL